MTDPDLLVAATCRFKIIMDHNASKNEELPQVAAQDQPEEVFALVEDEMAAVNSEADLVVDPELEVPQASDDAAMPTSKVERPASKSPSVGLVTERKQLRFGGLEPAAGSASGLDHFQQSSANFGSSKLDMVNDFKDHYTLSIPSSVVRFRRSHTATRVIANQNHQLLLEESVNPKTNQHEILIKRMEDSSNGAVQFLRMTYTLICAFWTGELLAIYEILVGILAHNLNFTST
jgi:hypothetical protein